MTTRSRPARTLRAALDEVRSGHGRARLAELREPGAAVDRSLLGASARWLFTDEADEMLADAGESRELTQDEFVWLERQLKFSRCMLPLLQADVQLGRELRALRLPSGELFGWPDRFARLARVDDERARAEAARELEHALRPIALQHAAAYARASAPLLGLERAPGSALAQAPRGQLIISPFSVEALAPTRAAPAPEPWSLGAAEFLAQTDAAAEDAVRHCLRTFRVSMPIPWHLLLRGLRVPELDSDSGAKQRWQRAAAWLRGIGFAPELQGRMRAEPDRGAALPFATTVPIELPLDVRVAQGALDYGVSSDLLGAAEVGRALGHSLVQVALPTELRWPIGASVGGVLGGLSLQLWGDREHLQRVQGLPLAAAERVGRAAGALALLLARAWVALATAPDLDPDHPGPGLEALADALGRALCCEVPPSVAGLLGADRLRARAHALEQLAALCVHAALREGYDSDWFRNPRIAELLRSVCERGNALQPDALCEELGVSLTQAAVRANQLVS